MKEEKPRSKVIPLCWLCGFLSKEAVDSTRLKTLAFFERIHLIKEESTKPTKEKEVEKRREGKEVKKRREGK